jgi:hypothetical protein
MSPLVHVVTSTLVATVLGLTVSAAHANVTYDYQGTQMILENTGFGPNTITGITGWVTFSSAALPTNQSDITSQVVAWSFTQSDFQVTLCSTCNGGKDIFHAYYEPSSGIGASYFFSAGGVGAVAPGMQLTGPAYGLNLYTPEIFAVTPAMQYVSNNYGTLSLAPVPEPETYDMMLTGLGLMGFMVSRKKSV